MILEAVVVRSLGIQSGVSKTTGNPWEKAEILVETQGQYPKKIALSNMKKAQEFAALPVGQAFKFGIDIESREYNGKFFTNVTAYSFEPIGAQQPQQAYPQPQQGNPYQQPQSHPYAQTQGNPYAQGSAWPNDVPAF